MGTLGLLFYRLPVINEVAQVCSRILRHTVLNLFTPSVQLGTHLITNRKVEVAKFSI